MRQYEKFASMSKKERINEFYINLQFLYGEEVWIKLDKTHEISNYGRVRRIYNNGNKKLMKPNINSSHYMGIKIGDVSHNTSRWLYQAWYKLSSYDMIGKEVHHIDGNPYNNHISNLQCLTSKEHASIHPERRQKTGCRKRKVEWLEIKNGKIKRVIKRFDSIKDASVFRGISVSALDRYINDHMENNNEMYRYAD